MQKQDKSFAKTVLTVGVFSTVGFSFVLAVVIGAWSGWLFDEWLGTEPAFFLILFFIGLAAGIMNVYRAASKFQK